MTYPILNTTPHLDTHPLLHNAYIDVKAHFGAKGDGVADDTTAIAAAVSAAAAASGTRNDAAVYVPAGIYKVTTSGVFTPSDATSLGGIHFIGTGWNTSIIRLSPSGSDLYFYDNVATARTQFCTFTDLGFEGKDPATVSTYTDISPNAKGFRLYATGATGNHEQGFRFTRCRFSALDTVFETAGDNTASENHFVDCKITHVRTVVLSINNFQSFNHEFHGTDIETIWGDVFSVGANGGGAVKMFGGSVIMVSGAAATYFLKAVGATGPGAYPFVFNGVRFELKGATTGLVSISTTKEVNAHFEACGIQDQHTATKALWVTIGAYAKLDFHGCTFFEPNGAPMRIVVNTGALYGESGTITFDACELPTDWSDRCSLSDFFGGIRAVECYGANVGVQSAGVHYAHDFDLHWDEGSAGQVGVWDTGGGTLKSEGSPHHNQWRLKTAQMKFPTEFWPDSASANQHTLKLPKNALVKSIHLRKPPHASDVTSTTLRVGRDDKTGTDHLVVTAAFNASHIADVTNYFYHVGATVNERTLRLYTNEDPTGSLQGGICIVEYY